MERALGVGLADLALTWDPQYGQTSAAPNAQRRPRPRDSGVSQSLERKAAVGNGWITEYLNLGAVNPGGGTGLRYCLTIH